MPTLEDALKDKSWLDKVWFSPAGLQSYHTDRSANYNEQNTGLGAEYDISPHWKLAGGQFDNSVNHQSQYGGAALLGRPLNSMNELRAGALMGLINGYPEMKKGGLFPMLAPMLAYEGKNFGMNVMGLPKVGNISPVVAAQMKFRF
jgi:hypothetical protein